MLVVVMVVITPRENGCVPLTKDISLDYKLDFLSRVRSTSVQFSIYQTLLNVSDYKMPMITLLKSSVKINTDNI